MNKVTSYLESINTLFEKLYGEEVLISDILKKTGLPDRHIKEIKEDGLKDFLNNFYLNFNEFLDRELPSRHYNILKELYGVDKYDHKKVANKLGFQEEKVRELEENSFNKLSEETKIRKIEGIIVRAAQDVLSKT